MLIMQLFKKYTFIYLQTTALLLSTISRPVDDGGSLNTIYLRLPAGFDTALIENVCLE